MARHWNGCQCQLPPAACPCDGDVVPAPGGSAAALTDGRPCWVLSGQPPCQQMALSASPRAGPGLLGLGQAFNPKCNYF